MKREKTGDKCCRAISSGVRVSHVYKDIWKPSTGDKLAYKREFHQSCQQRRNSGPLTTQVLKDSVVPF